MSSRYDTLRIDLKFLPVEDEQELEDLKDLEFQTKSLDCQFLDYHVGMDGYLYFEDFEYELVSKENKDGLFSAEMRKINQVTKKSYYNGDVLFYGKPYEVFYTFMAYFNDGELESVVLISKQ